MMCFWIIFAVLESLYLHVLLILTIIPCFSCCWMVSCRS